MSQIHGLTIMPGGNNSINLINEISSVELTVLGTLESSSGMCSCHHYYPILSPGASRQNRSLKRLLRDQVCTLEYSRTPGTAVESPKSGEGAVETAGETGTACKLLGSPHARAPSAPSPGTGPHRPKAQSGTPRRASTWARTAQYSERFAGGLKCPSPSETCSEVAGVRPDGLGRGDTLLGQPHFTGDHGTSLREADARGRPQGYPSAHSLPIPERPRSAAPGLPEDGEEGRGVPSCRPGPVQARAPACPRPGGEERGGEGGVRVHSSLLPSGRRGRPPGPVAQRRGWPNLGLGPRRARSRKLSAPPWRARPQSSPRARAAGARGGRWVTSGREGQGLTTPGKQSRQAVWGSMLKVVSRNLALRPIGFMGRVSLLEP